MNVELNWMVLSMKVQKNKGKCCYALFDVHKPNIQISDICYKKST